MATASEFVHDQVVGLQDVYSGGATPQPSGSANLSEAILIPCPAPINYSRDQNENPLRAVDEYIYTKNFFHQTSLLADIQRQQNPIHPSWNDVNGSMTASNLPSNNHLANHYHGQDQMYSSNEMNGNINNSGAITSLVSASTVTPPLSTSLNDVHIQSSSSSSFHQSLPPLTQSTFPNCLNQFFVLLLLHSQKPSIHRRNRPSTPSSTFDQCERRPEFDPAVYANSLKQVPIDSMGIDYVEDCPFKHITSMNVQILGLQGIKTKLSVWACTLRYRIPELATWLNLWLYEDHSEKNNLDNHEEYSMTSSSNNDIVTEFTTTGIAPLQKPNSVTHTEEPLGPSGSVSLHHSPRSIHEESEISEINVELMEVDLSKQSTDIGAISLLNLNSENQDGATSMSKPNSNDLKTNGCVPSSSSVQQSTTGTFQNDMSSLPQPSISQSSRDAHSSSASSIIRSISPALICKHVLTSEELLNEVVHLFSSTTSNPSSKYPYFEEYLLTLLQYPIIPILKSNERDSEIRAILAMLLQRWDHHQSLFRSNMKKKEQHHVGNQGFGTSSIPSYQQISLLCLANLDFPRSDRISLTPTSPSTLIALFQVILQQTIQYSEFQKLSQCVYLEISKTPEVKYFPFQVSPVINTSNNNV